MTTLNAPWFDLDLAIDLSRRLARLEMEPGVPRPSPESHEYVAFDLNLVEGFSEVPVHLPAFSDGQKEQIEPYLNPEETTVSEPQPASATDPATSATELKNQRFDSWEQCVMWCNQVTGAAASFVIDSQGFIIANYGRIPADGLDGIGAELCYAIEMLNKISPGFGKVAWVDLDYDNSRIVGFQAGIDEGSPFILGFISPNSSYFSQKINISRTVNSNLPTIM